MTDNNYMMNGTKRVYEKMMTFAQQPYVDWNTIESRYLEVIYNAMMQKNSNYNGKTSARFCIDEWHPISRPHGRAMVRLLWDLQRKLTAIYRECTVVTNTSVPPVRQDSIADCKAQNIFSLFILLITRDSLFRNDHRRFVRTVFMVLGT